MKTNIERWTQIMKKYVLAGTGIRGTNSYIEPLTENFADCGKLVGVYDTNPK